MVDVACIRVLTWPSRRLIMYPGSVWRAQLRPKGIRVPSESRVQKYVCVCVVLTNETPRNIRFLANEHPLAVHATC